MSPLDYKLMVQGIADQILHDAEVRGTNGKLEAEDFILACNDFDRAPIVATFADGTSEIF